MRTMKYGSEGPDVQNMQIALQGHVANLITPDGIYGSHTEAAVLDFQKRSGLHADGIVGPITAKALGLSSLDEPVAEWAVQLATDMWEGKHKVKLRANIPLIVEALEDEGIGSEIMIVYALATVYVETGDCTPKQEGISKFNTEPGGPSFGKYDGRRNLGNTEPGDGARFKGRGYVQLTGRHNYTKYGERTGIDLVHRPESACNPEVAACLLSCYLADNRNRILSTMESGRLDSARAVVNGGTNGLSEFRKAVKRGIAFLRANGKPLAGV